MADSQYTFDAEANDYFQGADLSVTDGTGHTILVNEKDGLLAVNVKDQQTYHDMPTNAREAYDQIGEARALSVYEGLQQEFWRWADEAAQRYEFSGVSQEGRGGGWLAVADTSGFGVGVLLAPHDADDESVRERFLALAFEVERSIEEDWLPRYYEALKAAAAEPSDDPLFTVAFSEGDVRGMAEEAGVNVEKAIERGHEYARSISERLTELGNELLYDHAVQSLRLDELAEKGPPDLSMSERRCPTCHAITAPKSKEGELECPNGHTFDRDEAFFVTWENEIPYESGAGWTEFDFTPFKPDPETDELADGVARLDRMSVGARFEDTDGERFWKAADGPVQGGVVVTDGEEYQIWDGGTLMKEVR